MFTEPAGAALAGGLFLAVAILYRKRIQCRIGALLTSGFWFYIAFRHTAFDGNMMSQLIQHVAPAFVALLFSSGTLLCIFSKDQPAPPTAQDVKQKNYAKYVKQSLRVGIEEEIIIENLVERGLVQEEAVALVRRMSI